MKTPVFIYLVLISFVNVYAQDGSPMETIDGLNSLDEFKKDLPINCPTTPPPLKAEKVSKESSNAR